MNPIVIGLGITIIILIFILYTFYNTKSNTLSSTASLKATNPSITSISEPTSTRYAYGIWVYVNSWGDNSNKKVIFSRANNMSVYLSPSSPILNCDIVMSDTTTKTIQITDNFPLQRWIYIIISLDNQFLDCYLDGKLVKSSRLYSVSNSTIIIPATPSSDTATSPIVLGSSNPFDAVISKFTRWTNPMDPGTAWTTYLSSNSSSFFGSLKSYGASLNILKDNSNYANLQLF
jgi:hypothetical protein